MLTLWIILFILSYWIVYLRIEAVTEKSSFWSEVLNWHSGNDAMDIGRWELYRSTMIARKHHVRQLILLVTNYPSLLIAGMRFPFHEMRESCVKSN